MDCHEDQTDKHHQRAFGICPLIVIVYVSVWRRVVVRVSVIAHVVSSRSWSKCFSKTAGSLSESVHHEHYLSLTRNI